MKKETMAVLKMVEEGKISADEACKLIETLSAGSTLSAVKEGVYAVVDSAKPVVKKAADTVKNVSIELTDGAKKSVDIISSKISEMRNKPRKADFDHDVVVEPVHEEGNGPEDITDKTEIISDKAEKAAEVVKDKAENMAESVSDKVGDMAESVSDKADNMADNISDKAEDMAESVSDKAGDMAEAVQDKVGDMAEAVSDKAESMADNIEDKIK